MEGRARSLTVAHDGVALHARFVAAAALSAITVAALLATVRDPVLLRAAVIAALYLVLLLTEAVPPFVPTLFLLVAVPVALAGFGEQFALRAVMTWPADPVLALFAGGLTLGLAAHRHSLDSAFAARLVLVSRSQRRRLLGAAMFGTALMSMWISNIAAPAVMFIAFRPIVAELPPRDSFRRALLLAVAVGANLGGMATPIGTGPNAIAISAISDLYPVNFIRWMSFALPLVVIMLALALGMLTVRYAVRGSFRTPMLARAPATAGMKWVVGVFIAVVILWLAEPLHHFSAPVVALAAMVALFGSGLLGKQDLGSLDWSTLALIAGGITLGKLIEQTGLLAAATQDVPWQLLPALVAVGALVLASALLSGVMSNTATAALLIPLAMSLNPSPSSAVLIAIAASFGMPFAISTPANAMAYGEGGLTAWDLLSVGLPLMIIGSALITLTGPSALRLLGVP